MIISKTCKAIAEGVIANIEYSEDNLDARTLEKRLDVIAIFIFTITTLLTLGFLFDIWMQLFLSSIAFTLIRMINGGNHFNSPDACYIVTTSVIAINPVVKFEFNGLESYVFILCLLVYLFMSPHTGEGKVYIYKKILLISMLILSYLICREIMFMYLILIPDLLIKNPIWRRRGV